MSDEVTRQPPLVGIDRLTVASRGDSTKITLGVGAVHVATKPNLVWTVLGSCVSMVLFVPRMKVSAICHAQLPKPGNSVEPCSNECPHPCFRNRSDTNAFRFVTCCAEYMFKALDRMQVRKSEIAASVIGGASLLGIALKRSVGNQNVEIARQILESHGISVAYDNTGGTHGRAVTYATDTGQIDVRLVRPIS
jgi:chemotaxis protein CheD